MLKSKLFELFFCSVDVWTFSEREEELPYSKLFEELLCLSLNIMVTSDQSYTQYSVWQPAFRVL